MTRMKKETSLRRIDVEYCVCLLLERTFVFRDIPQGKVLVSYLTTFFLHRLICSVDDIGKFIASDKRYTK